MKMKPRKLTKEEKQKYENRFEKIMDEKFEFKIAQEFLVYQNVAGKNFTKKEIKNYPELRNEEFVSEWEKVILERYIAYDKAKSREFENYLTVGINSCNI